LKLDWLLKGRGMASNRLGNDVADMARSCRLMMLWTAPTLRHRSALGWLR